MKKLSLKIALMCAILMSSASAGAQSLQDILGGLTGGSSSSGSSSGSDLISGLVSILTGNKATEKSIVGTWEYTEPAVVLSSDNLLTNVAAKAAAEQIETKLQTYLTKYGIKPGAMSITFKDDGTFTETIGSKTTSGTWKLDDGQLVITYGKVKPISITTQVEGKKLLIVTDATKLLNLMQVLGAQSSNSTISTVTTLMKGVKGMQCGLTFVKKQ